MTEAAPTILVTGGSGQVGAALGAIGAAQGVRVAGRPEFDFDRPEGITDLLRAAAPALVVNAAAYTAVDAAETEPEAAVRANRDGPALLARFCAESGIPLIHISTDYVFDGSKGAPYVETDPTHPTGVYGASKLAGEQAVLALCPRAVVLRTSWVYAASGRNFVRTMLNAAAKTRRLRVVADQIGCPTAAPDLAAAILAIAARIREEGWRAEFGGVFHACGTGSTSWHGLACATFEAAARYGLEPPVVEAITTAEWPTPARRPADSRLDCARLKRVFGLALPPWPGSLSTIVETILSA
jgi:dTDP-4-dehydrorhamnose reductase